MFSPASLAFASLSHAYIHQELTRQRKRGILLTTASVSSMTVSDNSPYQFAKLCKRCACLQLRSTTLDDIQLRNPSVGEWSQEQEVDLDWNVTNYLSIAFHPGGDKCDACEFLRRVVKWWRVYDESVRALEIKRVPVSLHYVFTLGEADQYGLKALRIRLRPGIYQRPIDTCAMADKKRHRRQGIPY